MSKNNLRRKRFHLKDYSLSSGRVNTGIQCRNTKDGTKAVTMEKCCLLASTTPEKHTHTSSITQACLPRNGTAHNELGPPLLTRNKENGLKTLSKARLIWNLFSAEFFSLLKYLKVSQADSWP